MYHSMTNLYRSAKRFEFVPLLVAVLFAAVTLIILAFFAGSRSGIGEGVSVLHVADLAANVCFITGYLSRLFACVSALWFAVRIALDDLLNAQAPQNEVDVAPWKYFSLRWIASFCVGAVALLLYMSTTTLLAGAYVMGANHTLLIQMPSLHNTDLVGLYFLASLPFVTVAVGLASTLSARVSQSHIAKALSTCILAPAFVIVGQLPKPLFLNGPALPFPAQVLACLAADLALSLLCIAAAGHLRKKALT